MGAREGHARAMRWFGLVSGLVGLPLYTQDQQ